MPGEPKSLQQLTSWKDVADYLGVAVRTAQEWEHEKGLPVRRMLGGKGRVSADPAELDHWKTSVFRSSRWWSKPPYFRIYVVVSTLLLIAAAGYEFAVYMDKSRHGDPAQFHTVQMPLVVVDHQENRPSGRASLDKNASPEYANPSSVLNHKITFVDFDGDGELEILLDYSPADPLWNSGSRRKSGPAGEWAELVCAHCEHTPSPGDAAVQKSPSILPQ